MAMRIDLNLPPEKAQTFLLYFSAEAKKPAGPKVVVASVLRCPAI